MRDSIARRLKSLHLPGMISFPSQFIESSVTDARPSRSLPGDSEAEASLPNHLRGGEASPSKLE
jgi:hypothetical protein